MSMGTVVLGRDVESGEAVSLGLVERRQGLYVIGKNGTGKTTLLESIIVQDIAAGLGVCVLDPHGDLTDAIAARIPNDRERDVILLDLADSRFPFGLNIFECRDLNDRILVGRIARQAVEMFEKLWGDTSWGPQLAQILRNVAFTLVENQGYTLAEVPRLLRNQRFRAKLTANIHNPRVREFWELEFNPLREQDRDRMTQSTLNKIDDFLTPPLDAIVGFGRTTIDFRDAMDSGRIVLVKLAIGHVGSGPVSLVGAAIVGQVLNAALSRQDIPQTERRQFNLYADEYHRFATPAFAELLTEARKFAVATTLAHQFRGQLTDEGNRGATLNAANLIVFSVNGDDAEELAKQFDRTPPPPDVAGYRPKLTICQDPIAHLVRSGHDHPRVRDIVEQRLQPWVRLHDQAAPKELLSPIWNYSVLREEIAFALSKVNHYLVEVTEGRVTLGSSEEAALLAEIVYNIRGLIGFAPQADDAGHRHWDIYLLADTEKRLLEWIKDLVTLSTFTGMPVLDKYSKKYDLLVSSRSHDHGSGRESANRYAREETLRAGEAVLWLNELGRRLAARPILVDSGQWEPYFDRARSYSDVEAEVASKLSSLPKFHARCRLLNGSNGEEHTVHTPEFEPRRPKEDATAMVGRIRERTRKEYCSPLDTVLRTIRERQQSDDNENRTTRQSSV